MTNHGVGIMFSKKVPMKSGYDLASDERLALRLLAMSKNGIDPLALSDAEREAIFRLNTDGFVDLPGRTSWYNTGKGLGRANINDAGLAALRLITNK